MGALKKGLDKFDLGTPLLAKLFGGTADYGEQADEDEEHAKAMSKANMTDRPTRVKPRPKTNVLS